MLWLEDSKYYVDCINNFRRVIGNFYNTQNYAFKRFLSMYNICLIGNNECCMSGQPKQYTAANMEKTGHFFEIANISQYIVQCAS